MEKVIDYRIRNKKITADPIVYKWWFKLDILKTLLLILDEEIEYNKIIIRNNYALLYVGSGINGHERLINYHILDKNNYHLKGIQNKRLSSLRQTI